MKIEKKKFVERWHSDAFENRQIALQIYNDVKKKLKVIPHPYTGWRSLPNQKLKTIEINKNGLRYKNLDQLIFKKNCILLGGSVAWGFGASSNENTPAYKIEKFLLTKYKLDFNIINLAEQSHSSIEEMNAFISTYHELEPKMIIILSGCNDMNFEFEKKYKKMDLYESILNFYLWGDKLGIFREKNLFKLLAKIIFRHFKKIKNLNDEFFSLKKIDETLYAEKMYEAKLDFISNFCEIKKIKLFNILQPDLLFKLNKSQFEKDYCDFQEKKKKEFIIKKNIEFEKKFFNQNKNTKYLKNFSLLNCFDKIEETIFVDRIHTADKGYEIIADKISDFIASNLD